MKIVFLMAPPAGNPGSEQTALVHAAWLAGAGHDVEVLNLFRGAWQRLSTASPAIRVRHLVNDTTGIDRPERTSGLDAAVCRTLAQVPSRLVEPGGRPRPNLVADLELEYCLRGLESDVLVCATPALRAACRLVPPRVIAVHHERWLPGWPPCPADEVLTPVPRLDALVVDAEPARRWFTDTLGTACPRVEIAFEPLTDGPRPRAPLVDHTVMVRGDADHLDHVLQAFARVAARHPDWLLKVVLAGTAPLELRKLVANLGLHDQVVLIPAHADPAEEWATASIAVVMTGGAAGTVCLDAFAAGVPVVGYGTDPHLAGLLTHGRNGLSVGVDDLGGLSAAMTGLIEDTGRRREYGAEALRVAAQHAAPAAGARFSRLLDELARGDGPGRAGGKADRAAAWLAHRSPGFVAAGPPESRHPRAADLAAVERRVRLANPGLLRVSGKLCTSREDLMPVDAARANLEMVTATLDRHGIDFWLIRDDGLRFRLAITEHQREATLRALATEFDAAPVYVETLAGTTVSGLTFAACLPDFQQAGTATGLRIFQPVAPQSRTLVFGAAYGCDVDFWTVDGAILRSPRSTPVGCAVVHEEATPTLMVGPYAYPTLTAFTTTPAAQPSFPIDLVYTWVDSGDPRWRVRRDAAFAELDWAEPGAPAAVREEARGEVRFRSRDELRYSLRSVEMFAPWLRHVWLVTDGQAPPWLDTDHPRITVVDHGSIFGTRGRLPSFNSKAIESQLHHIDGLAEHFIYLNDDFFLGRPVQPDLFFHANGVAKFFLSPTAIPPMPVDPLEHFSTSGAKNNRRLIRETFGRELTHALKHAPYALRRSVLNEIEERFAVEHARTAASQTRARTDISVPSSLHHFYGFLTGRCVPGRIRSRYVNTAAGADQPLLTELLSTRSYDAFCLNDTAEGDLDAATQANTVRAFLASYFPVASGFERFSPRNRLALSDGPAIASTQPKPNGPPECRA